MRKNKFRWTITVILTIAAAMAAQTPALAQPSDKPPLPAPPANHFPEAPAPPPGFNSWAEVMAVQGRLHTAAERIAAHRDNAFTGFVVSADQRKLSVYWKGQPPAAAARAIDDARRDVSVEVFDAPYSEAELLAETRRVAQMDGVTAVGPNADGTGLTVSLAPGRSLSPERRAPIKSNVPITKTDTAAFEPASRGNDSPPYWGGARWSSPLGNCSTGFGIIVNGFPRMLSAGHCGRNGDTARDGGGDVMGTVSGDNDAYDRLYITTPVDGFIYDGPVGTGEFRKPVVGAQFNFVDDYVCTSGAYSGARCFARVTFVNRTVNIGYDVHGIVVAESLNRTAMAGNSDSGGPVFSLDPGDPNKVLAKGTITGYDTATIVPCPGVPSSPSRACGWRFVYADVVGSLLSYGAGLVVGG